MHRNILSVHVLSFLCFFYSNVVQSQVLINEIQASNSNTISDQFENYGDWIELYNAGNSPVNLNGYGLSDDVNKPFLFQFPDTNIAPQSHLLVFASDTNLTDINYQWRTAVNSNSTWNYRANTNTPPDTNWRNMSFTGNWASGIGGFGFGDGDDATVISTCISVYVRKIFTIQDTSKIKAAIFNIDYDDGFVAYLNGKEFARVNTGIPGIRPAWNTPALAAREAKMYQGGEPDSFYLDKSQLTALLRNGNNLLAIEVHNQSSTNNDLTCRPWLSFLVSTGENVFEPVPSFFKTPAKNFYHAAFKIGRNGETLFLTNPVGVIVDQKFSGQLESNVSIGRNPDGSSNWCLFETASPGISNNSPDCSSGYANTPVFSLSGGFYNSSQELRLSTSFPGAVIRYSTDGSEVNSSSPVYTQPIRLDTTQTIRAAVFAIGSLPGQTVTNSYFISEQMTLPVFSITTDPKHLWDYNTGIFVKGPNAGSSNPYWGANYWQPWEKPVTAEYFDRSKNRAFRFNSGMKITGGWSRSAPQKSLEIMLGDKYGQSKLNYPLMESVKPYRSDWDNFILHTTGNDRNQCKMRDPLMNRLLKPTHNDHLAYEPCLVFINGQNWGVYYFRENDDHHWIEGNYGYKKDEIDLLKESYFYPGMEVKKGSNAAFYSMYHYATTTSPSSPNFYSTMATMMDIENMVDYFIAETYYPNDDWMGGSNNNLKLWRPKKEGGRFRYLIYDLDFGLGYSGTVSKNMLSVARNASPHNHNSEIFKSLTNNTTFRRYFINRYADLINTIFKPSNIESMINLYRDTLKHDMHLQWEAWGGDSANWISRINSMITFAKDRPAYARNIVQSEFGLSGQVNLTLQVQPAGAGRIQISTITPESLPWTGVYFNGNPVTITAIPNPGYSFDHWRSNVVINQNNHNQSATFNFTSNDVITAYFSGSTANVDMAFTEINYHSHDTLDAGDWVEIRNKASYQLDVSGWKFRDDNDRHVYQFPTGSRMNAGEYLVLASSLSKFNTIFPDIQNVRGDFGFDFSNSGENLRLFDHRDSLIISVYYQDQLPWPVEADGQGYTLELRDNSHNPNNGISWFAGCLGGSPGGPYSAPQVSVTAMGNVSFCDGESVTLNGSASSTATFQWMKDVIDIPAEVSSTLVVNSSGMFKLRVTDQGCSSISDSLLITAIPSETVNAISPVQRCDGGSLELQANGSSLLKWYDSSSGTNEIGSGSTFTTPNLTQSTTYYVKSIGVCPSPMIEVQALVIPSNAIPSVQSAERCGAGELTLHAVASSQISWYENATGGTAIFTGESFYIPSLQVSTVFYAEAGGDCPSARVAVNAGIIPVTADPIVNDMIHCGPGVVTFSVNDTGSIRWYDSVSGTQVIASGNVFTTPFLSATTTYYVEAGSVCPSNKIPARAVIKDIAADPLVTDAEHCGPGSLTLSASGTSLLSWYNQPGGTFLATGNTYTTGVIYSDKMYYVRAGDDCPGSFVPVQARILSLPVPELGNDTVIENGSLIVLNPGNGFASYVWSDFSSNATLSVSNPGMYSVTVYDANGCSASDSIDIFLVTGISKHHSTDAFNIFPNPTSSHCTVNFGMAVSGGSISLYDHTGKNVREIQIHKNEISRTLDLQGLSAGLYQLRFVTAQTSIVKSILIQ